MKYKFIIIAGSRYWQGGTFEVVKSTSSSEQECGMSTTPSCSLEVIIPSELEGVAFIQVEVKSIQGNLKVAKTIFLMKVQLT